MILRCCSDQINSEQVLYVWLAILGLFLRYTDYATYKKNNNNNNMKIVTSEHILLL